MFDRRDLQKKRRVLCQAVKEVDELRLHGFWNKVKIIQYKEDRSIPR
jgi:hypothetical protein